MPRTPILAACLTILMVSPVLAAEVTVGLTADRHVTLVQGGSFVLSGPTYDVPLTGVTGLFGWGSDYNIGAGVQPNLTGGYTAGLGASVGAAPGKPGSVYSLRIGGGWTGSWFSVNPVSQLGKAEVSTVANDVALSLTYNRPILPGLSLTGAAEAHRPVGASAIDPLGGTSQLVIGAGIGLRF